MSYDTENEAIDDICAFKAWVENFRVAGKTNAHAQIYFQIHSAVLWKILIENGKEIFKKEGLSVLLKRIKAKGWNRKIGILLGLRTEVASLKEYEEESQEYYQMDLSIFELKKKIEKEGRIASKCAEVHAIDAKAEKMDSKLRKLSFYKFDALSYYSCINGAKNQQKEALLLNRLQNVKMRHEIMKEAHIKDIVKMNRVEMTFRKALLSAQVNEEDTFQLVE